MSKRTCSHQFEEGEYIAILSTSLRTAQRVASKHATGSTLADHDKANRLEWPVFP